MTKAKLKNNVCVKWNAPKIKITQTNMQAGSRKTRSLREKERSNDIDTGKANKRVHKKRNKSIFWTDSLCLLRK